MSRKYINAKVVERAHTVSHEGTPSCKLISGSPRSLAILFYYLISFIEVQ